MTYLALRHRIRVAETLPPVLPAHTYAPEQSLNLAEDGRPLVDVAAALARPGLFMMTLTHHPLPLGSKKDDE